MSVVWAATSPESGLFHPVERRSEVEDLSDRFNDLRSCGQGYLEVRSPNREFPVLILAFRDKHAVVHLMSEPLSSSVSADQERVDFGDDASDAVGRASGSTKETPGFQLCECAFARSA